MPFTQRKGSFTFSDLEKTPTNALINFAHTSDYPDTI